MRPSRIPLHSLAGKPPWLMPALAALLSVAPRGSHAAATVFVDLNVETLGGGIYEYSAAVSNDGPDDVAIVSLVDGPPGDPWIAGSLAGPTGFTANYDGGLGIVDWLADLSFASGTTTSPFVFRSQAEPTSFFRLFEGLTVDGDPFSGRVRYGAVSVPDAGNALVALLAGAVCLMATRRSSGNRRTSFSFGNQTQPIHR